MDVVRRLPPRVRGTALIAVAVLIAAVEVTTVLGGDGVGIDFLSLRHAGESLLAGRSVYTDPTFVYPPTAAVALLPTALGTERGAFIGWLLFSVAAVALAGAPLCRATPVRHRATMFATAVLTLIAGLAAARSMYLGNLTEVLVPVAVAVLLAFHRGRWIAGCALLMVSLLVKPLLAPLLLVPLLHRRWTALGLTMVPAGGALLASVLLVPGGDRYAEVLRYCLSGTNLHGANATNNISLRGWAEAHQVPAAYGVVAAGVVLGLLAARVAVALRSSALRRSGPPSPIWLGNIVMLGALLVGALSEVNYMVVAVATALLLIAVRPDRRTVLLLLPALLLFGTPSAYVGLLGHQRIGQSWFVLAELLLFAALLRLPDTEPADPTPTGARTPPMTPPVPVPA